MSENIKQEDLIEPTPTSEVVTEPVTVETEDPLKTELEKVKGKGRTELEKAEFSLKKNAERLTELGGDPTSALGIKVPIENLDNQDDNVPITRGELKKALANQSSKTALQLAEEIEDSTERELVKYNLENRINPSGNAQDDLRDARRIVNSIRNEQIAQEQSRKTNAKTHSNATGAPTKGTDVQPDLSPEELVFTRPPFNMSVAAILKTRQK